MQARTFCCALAMCGALMLSSGSLALAGERATGAPTIEEAWHQFAIPQGRTLRLFVARPVRATRAPTVILLHEDRGLTAWEQHVACLLAGAGMTVLAPDFLSELGPQRGATESFESRGAVREALLNLSADQIMRELNGVVAFARDLPHANQPPALVGFDWGATQAFRYAGQDHAELSAVFVFYGATPNDETLQRIQAPVHGFYGEKDVTISAGVAKLKLRMAALNKPFVPVVYAGAQHGFLRTGDAPDAMPADHDAHEQAWTRLKSLLGAL